MNFTATKEWKELPFKIITIIVPTFPGVRITASDTTPSGETGIKYIGQSVEKYSEKKLWVKIPAEASQSELILTIENFI